MKLVIGIIIGIFIGAALGLVIFALLSAGRDDELTEKPAKLYTVGQTVLYDGQEWEIAQFNDLGDGQTGVEIVREGIRSYVMLEEVE